MLPSSAGRLLILLDERSRYTRLCSLAMSGGMRDSELSLRCRAVRWVRDQRAELRLLTRPTEKMRRNTRSFCQVPASNISLLVWMGQHGLADYTMWQMMSLVQLLQWPLLNQVWGYSWNDWSNVLTNEKLSNTYSLYQHQKIYVNSHT